MKKIITNGIKCYDGEKYTFLAYSNSQLRTQSCWFYRNNDLTTCDDIRKWMGNFSNIKNVAKYAARMGMCFSSTTSQHKVSKNEYIVIKDIKRNKSGNIIGSMFDIDSVNRYVENYVSSDDFYLENMNRYNYNYNLVDSQNETTKDEMYTFTDGCGLISKEFAKEIARSLDLKTIPSVFQFRFAGFKGVVVAYDFSKLSKIIEHVFMLLCHLLMI